MSRNVCRIAGGRRVADLMTTATAAVIAAGLIAACQPTVQVEAPDKPIVINMNVKIEHEVRVKVDRELDALIAEEPELF